MGADETVNEGEVVGSDEDEEKSEGEGIDKCIFVIRDH